MATPSNMELAWQKCQGNVWGSFHHVDLGHSHFNNMEGVYVIWQHNGPVVRVGQGKIKDRIAAHRNDPAVTAYPSLYVSWASVPILQRNAVERYLANALTPKVGAAFPNTVPLAVNLPWF